MDSREKLDFHLHKPLPRSQKKRVGVKWKGEKEDKVNSALNFCIQWLWESTYPPGKLLLLPQRFLCPLSCKQCSLLAGSFYRVKTLQGIFCLEIPLLTKIQCPVVSSVRLSNPVRLFALNCLSLFYVLFKVQANNNICETSVIWIT